jgi:hypothetical protein
LAKDPLWKEIFIDSHAVDKSDSESEDDDNFQEIYLKFCKDNGIKVDPAVFQ